MPSEVIDHPEQRRFELPLDGGAVATAHYRIDDGRVVLTHTEVPDAYSGQGIGSRLARGVFDSIRASGRKAVTECAFMSRFAERHPEYSDILDT
ncbi:MAG TPA: GNAT family N-acetyltransferase [Pseudomonadales bacterium]